MRTKITIISFFLLLFIFTCIAPQKASAQDGYVNFQIFYDELSPYGTWINSPDYGFVWIPDVASGFSPYETNGYWILTDDGWTWVSNYQWGWAPFHYGRWYTDNLYGPIWVPGYEWSPAWVSWRRSNDYYGWAPIGPGISISIAFGDGYNERHNHYTFVGRQHFGRRNINRYYINHRDNDNYFRNSSGLNNIRDDKWHNVRYNAGPDRAEVEKRSGKKFAPVPIVDSNKPGQIATKKQLQIYRPQVQQSASGSQKPVPKRVETLQNVKPAAQRTVLPLQKANQPVKQQLNNQKINIQQPNKQQQAKPQQMPNVQKQQQAKPQQMPNIQKQQQAKPQQMPNVQKQQQTKPQQMPNVQKKQLAKPQQMPNIQKQQQQKQQQAKPQQMPNVQKQQQAKPQQMPNVQKQQQKQTRQQNPAAQKKQQPDLQPAKPVQQPSREPKQPNREPPVQQPQPNKEPPRQPPHQQPPHQQQQPNPPKLLAG